MRFGPPDLLEPGKPAFEGGDSFPFEIWHYRRILVDGKYQDVDLEFVDPTMDGSFRLVSGNIEEFPDPQEEFRQRKEEFLHPACEQYSGENLPNQ